MFFLSEILIIYVLMNLKTKIFKVLFECLTKNIRLIQASIKIDFETGLESGQEFFIIETLQFYFHS